MQKTSSGLIVSFIAGCLGSSLLFPLQSAIAHSEFQQPLSSSTNIAQQIDFSRHFQDLNVEGSIIIYDLNNNQTYQHNSPRNSTPFLPASTFKILNSLISLETGVIQNELTILTWDGIERSFPQWNRDLNLKEAYRESAVWFYQVLARKVGYERMKDFVKQVGYGNENIGDPSAIDRFWLDGELRITPQEQIEFLQRLYRNNLPFSESTIATVKNIMIMEKTPAYTLRAKTGWATDSTPQIGWYVGYLEQGENVYFFATNINIINPENDVPARLEVTRRCLQDLGLF